MGLLALFLTACSTQEEVSTVQTPQPEVESTFSPNLGSITSNGTVLPVRRMALSFGMGGFVEVVDVQIGGFVKAGQTLARLDTTEGKLALQRAEAELASAQANFSLVAAGFPAEKQAAIAASSLELIASQQALEEIYENADIVAAQALMTLLYAQEEVDVAQRRLNGLGTSANQVNIDAAFANMILAKDQLEKAQEEFDRWKYKPETNITRAVYQSNLAQAQQVYDTVVRKYNNLSGAASEHELSQAEAELILAQVQLTSAQAAYETLSGSPDPEVIALAEARILKDQAQLALAETVDPTDQLALAQAQVDSARVNLDTVQLQVNRMTITAPFDGVVSAVLIRVGEWAKPGEMVIELLDVSRWRIETKNVGELQIGQVEVGGEVRVWVNAFLEEMLTGYVTAISPVAIVQQGNTTYTLMIELEPTDLKLWSGMTARVEILIDG
jgi:HlyD family secretion protein